jgi:hypothetical protein
MSSVSNYPITSFPKNMIDGTFQQTDSNYDKRRGPQPLGVIAKFDLDL